MSAETVIDASPAGRVVQACDRAEAWLRESPDRLDPAKASEVRALADSLHRRASREQLGREVRLAAAETLRRAERGLALAIRHGQENGTVVRHGGGRPRTAPATGIAPRPVTDFAASDDLSGTGGQPGYYRLADGVSSEEFEQAVKEARAEGNLSRVNVSRKTGAYRDAAPQDGEWVPAPADRDPAARVQRRKLITEWAGQGFSSRQIAGRLQIRDQSVRKIARDCGIEIGADKAVRGTRHLDSARIARETVQALEGLALGAALVNLSDITAGQAAEWAESLTDSTRVLNRFARNIKEITR